MVGLLLMARLLLQALEVRFDSLVPAISCSNFYGLLA